MKNKLLPQLSFILLLNVITLHCLAQNAAITDSTTYNPHPSAMLDVYSTSKGMLVPRLTSPQRASISNPATGLLVFDIDSVSFYFYNGNSWQNLSAPGSTTSSIWSVNNDKVFLNNQQAKVGIGTSNPVAKLTVAGDAGTSVNDTLFVVRNKNGEPVFAVFPEGVHVWMADGANGNIGGFAVSGKSSGKEINEYFRITPDSVRIYINDSATKGNIGGFAISGRSAGKKGTINDFFNISGSNTPDTINPSQARIVWYPKKEAFLVGRVQILSPDSVGLNSFASGFESKAMGNYSQAMGYQSIAKGNYSSSIGYRSQSNMDHSYAFGTEALAGGYNSYAIGFMAEAFGYSGFSVLSQGNFAIGQTAKAQGDYSYAIGLESRASNHSAYAIGAQTLSTGLSSYAIGYFAKSTAMDAFAIGYHSEALANKAFALGSYSIANDNSAYAIGDNSISEGMQAYAIGYSSKALGDGSYAIGSGAIADTNLAFAIGTAYLGIDTTRASGIRSFAIGSNSVASGLFSLAIGNSHRVLPSKLPNIDASGYHSIVIGSCASSNFQPGAIVISDFNDSYKDSDILKATTEQQFLARAVGGFIFQTSKNPDASKTFAITGNEGNVGIGTTPSNYKLSLAASNNNTIQLYGSQAPNNYGATINFGNNNNIFIKEDQDDKLKINAYDRLAITGSNDLKTGINETNPTHVLSIRNNSADKNTLQLIGTGAGNGWYTKLSFGTDDKTYIDHYSFDKIKLKVYNIFDIDGEANFKISIGDVTSKDHRLNIVALADNNALKLIGSGMMYENAKLTFGWPNDYTYIQEDEDDKMLFYADKRLNLTGGSNYKLGIKTSTPSTLVDIGGGTRNRVTASGNNLLIQNDLEIDHDLYVENNATIFGILDHSANPNKPKIYVQDDEPNIDNNHSAFWVDSDSVTNDTYLIIDVNGIQKKVLMN